MRHAELVLRIGEDIVPQTRFEMTFGFWQVEVGTGSACELIACVVEKGETEIKEACRNLFTIDQYLSFVQVPAARPDHKRRDDFSQLVPLAVFLFKTDRTPHSVTEIGLPDGDVLPR